MCVYVCVCVCTCDGVCMCVSVCLSVCPSISLLPHFQQYCYYKNSENLMQCFLYFYKQFLVKKLHSKVRASYAYYDVHQC